jgi:hypothetical protein
VSRTYREDIQAIAMERDVRFLFHFTQAANLPAIVTHGLRSRRDLAAAGCPFYPSDQWRLDDNNEAVSLSVSRTNSAMFTQKRYRSGHRDWVVLVLPSEILWTHDCVFCWCNAALGEIKKHSGFRGGPWAFRKMFEGNAEERQNLPPSFPTNPGAEVQVMEPIAPEHILGAVVDRQQMLAPVEQILNWLGGHRPVVVEGAD